LALVGLTGCTGLDSLRPESELQQVPTSPFPPSVTQTVKRVSLSGPAAASDIAWRVDAVGRKLIDSNGWVGLMPRFRAVGNSEPQISHLGTESVTISDALVHQCKSEAELAAVLASELGKMVAEREAVTARGTRQPESLPPTPLPIGSQGNPLDTDLGYVMAIARFERDHPKSARSKALPLPDPEKVAGELLKGAGFSPSDLETVAPLLQSPIPRISPSPEPGVNWRPQ
jgi:hypothetical protein